MNGGQDLGGMMGFGPVRPEPNEPVFHADWEKRVIALALAMGFTGEWSIDGGRYAREILPPPEYMTSRYYEIWLKALERQVVQHGLVTPAELASGTASSPPKPVARRLAADEVGPKFRAGFPSSRPVQTPALYAVGDAVLTRNMHPAGHTRLPRYARGRRGRIETVHGGFVFPDTSAHGEGEAPQWMYTVGFDAAGIWGESAEPGQRITIAAFESYLLPVAGPS